MVLSILVLISVMVFQVRRPLLGQDLGTNWTLIAVGVFLFGILAWLGLACGRHMNHLSLATRMGVPELSSTERPQTLVRDGIYGMVRHPIYSSAVLAGLAYALIVNYVGVDVLSVAAIPMFYAIIVLEERELIDRFGATYREYQREVPRLVPRWRKTS
jgi:protein-S-isoprenylcysteine O-methyltransferase Ste14